MPDAAYRPAHCHTLAPDEHLNVKLPVFCIHGNHDDPTGADHHSALDVLSSAQLVNYFGKAQTTVQPNGKDTTGAIKVWPVLMVKGETKLALYGLGNMRDERLHRMFHQPEHVKFVRPAGDNKDDWFSVFGIHQNREGYGSKAFIPHNVLPDFLDLIVWGHEHESKPEPESVQGLEKAVVLQPGSTVVMQLTEAESKRKHACLLEVRSGQYRVTPKPIPNQRPFIFASVALRDHIAAEEAQDSEAVARFLQDHVEGLLSEHADEMAMRDEDARNEGRAGESSWLDPHKKPLVRVKVDYSGKDNNRPYTTINVQRFGQEFVGKVANPKDILNFSKAASKAQGKKAAAHGSTANAEAAREEELLRNAGGGGGRQIEQLVSQNLSAEMSIIDDRDLSLALQKYVHKDDKSAFMDMVRAKIEETAKVMKQRDATNLGSEQEVQAAVRDHAQALMKKRREAEGDGDEGVGGASTGPAAAAKGKAKARAPLRQATLADMDANREGGAQAKKRGRAEADAASGGDAFGEEGPTPARASKRAAAVTRKSPRGKAPAAAATRGRSTRGGGRATARCEAQVLDTDSDEDDPAFAPTEDGGSEDSEMEEAAGAPNMTSRGRAASQRGAVRASQRGTTRGTQRGTQRTRGGSQRATRGGGGNDDDDDGPGYRF